MEIKTRNKYLHFKFIAQIDFMKSWTSDFDLFIL